MTDQPKLFPVETKADFRMFRLQCANPATLLDTIILRWRDSHAHMPNDPHPWAVWPLVQWSEWLGWGGGIAGTTKVKRALRVLEDHKLIERRRYPFGGKTFYAYLRPTKLALEHAGKPQDFARCKA